MFIVTVVFEIKPEKLQNFMTEMLLQADNSLLLEPDCHQFDVCQETDEPNRVFLYEVYSNEPAFQVHLASEHFATFSAHTHEWINEKTVNTWLRS
ncbi:putative quinol monooxygenase [Sedimenticola selenatireducens]|uniref:Antibiotic biosynthesis monooxygenase n=1 Tax=Sedimenticola selenatireducens TaxID=191960 RepID=A0A557SKC8_9GAMM|nr:putative quinol monooxygenase [Sedimenticola selenatireducens]TVO77895.1 antibiotic biosynthesis monooxygenase [Sedimenticola selenatireducens]TVT65200.1 MAG: antibiotic biosynthesis monooxygenase [Sedimenticola selenatireducens]